MSRAPFQVLVLPCRHDGERWRFAVFQRADADVWQGIAGGGEDDETPLQAAVREAVEEAGIGGGTDLIPLDSTGSVPADCFPDAGWGDDVRVVPEHSFGVVLDTTDLTLSDEHRRVVWLDAADALERLTFASNRTALRELHVLLLRRATR